VGMEIITRAEVWHEVMVAYIFLGRN